MAGGAEEGRAGRTGERMDDVRESVVGAEGFYRVGKDAGGRWWLLTPDGTPVIYKGCCAVCDGIPGKEYTRVYCETYGDDHARFVEDSTAILRDLGFNAYGMWCYLRTPDAGYDTTGMGYIEYIHAREVRPESAVKGASLVTVDAWDPLWQSAYDKRASVLCTRHRDNPNLVGYFVENEPFWGQIQHQVERGQEAFDEDQTAGRTWLGAKHREHRWGVDSLEGRKGGSLLQAFMSLEPGRPGHDEAWRFVLARHQGSVAQVAGDWEADFSSVEDFRRQSDDGLLLNTVAYGRDHDAFTLHFMRQFYRVTGEAIRRYDPNHLRLGVRHCADWTVHGTAVLKGYDDPDVRRHTDVCGINAYRDWPYETIAAYAEHFDMPILIGEYSWGGWAWEGQAYPPEWQNDHPGWLKQEGVYRTARMFSHPQVIGYTWFKWYCDNVDPEAPAYAVVTESHEVNRFNAPMFRRLHAVLEDVHAGALAPEDVLTGAGTE
jgi:hypothetical protein